MSGKSEFADERFKTYEWGDGTPYMGTLEGGPDSNAILNGKNAFLMTLKKGTSMDEALELVNHLNQHVAQTSIQQH